MAPELEKPRITEIQVRIDCNGCVQKIKKALHCISGIYEIYIDLPKQKITVIGWADPEKIIKAIKKTRRTATLCSHSELPELPSQPSGPQPGGEAPPPPEDGSAPPPPQPPQDAGKPPPTEGPQPQPEPPNDQPPPPEPPKDQQPPPPQPPPENQAPEAIPPPTGPEASSSQPPPHPSGTKDVGEVHVIDQHPTHHSSRHYPVNYHPPDYHPPPDYYPPDYSYRYGYSHRYDPAYTQGYGGHGPAYSHLSPNYRHEQPHQQPVHVSYNYNTYRPSPYVTQYEYVRSPPRYTSSTPYAPMDHQYHYAYGDYHRYSYNDNGNAVSVFSDENPNACTVV